MVAVILDLEKKADKKTENEHVEKKALQAEGIETAYLHISLDPEKRAIKEAEAGDKNVETHAVDAEETDAEYAILPQLNSFLFFFSLRAGTLMIGWTSAVISWVLADNFSAAYMHSWAVKIDETDEDVKFEASIKMRILAVLLFMAVSCAAVSIRLLVGVHKRKAAMLKPFMVMLFIYLALEIFTWLVGLQTDATLLHIGLKQCLSNCQYDFTLSDYFSYLSFVQRLLIGVYVLLVVNSYHTKLDRESVGYTCMV